MIASTDTIFTHSDGHPYYAIEVQKGDTISEMGSKKGYSYRESLRIYYADVNASAPSAVRKGKGNEVNIIKVGQIFYVPLRKAVLGQSVTHKISFPKYSVKCVYKDDPSEPVRDGYVLFWEYNQEGTKLNTHTKKSWKIPMSDFPVGYARTDGEGLLASTSDVKGAQFDNDTLSFSIKPQTGTFLKPKHNSKNHCYYLGPLKGEPKIISPKKLYCSKQGYQFHWAREYTWADDVSRFPGHNEMAFMAVPANVFKKLETVDINELGKNKDYVWKGKLQEFSTKEIERTLLKTNPKKKWHYYKKPDSFGNISFKEYKNGNAIEIVKNQCIIKIPCTLPEWIRRIQRQTERLEKAFKMYERGIRPHLEALLIIEKMQNVAELRAKFPYTPANSMHTIPNRELVTNWLLAEKLDELKEKITQNYLGSKNKENQIIHKKYMILEENGKELINLLNKREFLKEIKDYFEFEGFNRERKKLLKNELNNDSHKIEMLTVLCDTLLNAYTALSKTDVIKENLLRVNSEWQTTLADEVFDNDIESMLQQLRNNMDESYIEPSETPLSVIISAKTSAVAKWVANSPGPPSLGVGLIDAFGPVLSRRIMATKKLKIKNDKYFKLLLGAINLFRDSEDVKELTTNLSNRIVAGELNRGEISLSRLIFTSEEKNKLGKVFGKTFKGVMFLTSLLALKANMDENDDPRLTSVRWLKIVESTTGVVVSGAGIFFRRLAAAPKFGYLGVFACLCSAVISVEMAEIALRDGNISEAVYHGLSAASALVLCIGAVIGIFGFLFWAGVVTAVGVVFSISVEVGKALASNRNILEGMADQFKKTMAFKRYTSNEGDVLKTFYSAIAMLNKLPSRKLSWRGIIPMYLNGFVVYEENKSTKGKSNSQDDFEMFPEHMSRQIDYGETEDLLEKFVEAPETPVFPNYDAIPIAEALKIYQSVQKGEQSIFIDDNQDDGLKWREGIIFPELYPCKRSPVYLNISEEVAGETHILKMKPDEIIVYDTEEVLYTESWLSFKRKRRKERHTKFRWF